MQRKSSRLFNPRPHRPPLKRIRGRGGEWGEEGREESHSHHRLRHYGKKITFWFFFVLIGVISVLALGIASAAFHKSRSIVSPIKIVPISYDDNTTAVVIPSYATKIRRDVYHLGTVIFEGKELNGYAFLHYNDEPSKVQRASENCFILNAEGAKWKTPEPYGISTTNSQGLTDSFILTTFNNAIEKWDSEVTSNIFGSYSAAIIADGADFSSPDGKNEMQFGNIAESGVIAVTVTWGVFSGPINDREIVEWDQVYDQIDFTWGDSTETGGVMDFDNIATHELGHSCGLGDLYSSSCSDETMYGFSSVGETKKRTLEIGDTTGLCVLYGECAAPPGMPSPASAAISSSSSSNWLIVGMITFMYYWV